MRIMLQPAFILHTRPFRDTSLLVDLLTLNHGRIQVVARSARGMRSRFKGLLQPFIPFLASWSGKGELMSLNQLESQGAPYFLTKHRLISGFYLNELLVRLLYRHDAHPHVYLAYENALKSLERGDSAERLLRLFELQLLAELGYGLPLEREALTGDAIAPLSWYRYEPTQGFIESFGAQETEPLFCGKTLLALHCAELKEEDLQAAKRLMRLVLAPHLGNKLIRSRELFIDK